MPFTDLIRATVLLAAAEATALAAIAVLAAQRDDDSLTLLVAGGWWIVAAAAGLAMGRFDRASEGVRPALSEARMATQLPVEGPARIAFGRLWPILATALLAGGLGVFLPGVAAVGAGFALLVALAWRGREAAVLAIEQRDGARFYVVPTPALRPIKLMRSPGLGRDRDTTTKYPPPPTAPA